MKRNMVVLAALLQVGSLAWSGSPRPVGDALERTALMSPAARGAVLLGIANSGRRIVSVGERGVILISDTEGASWRQAVTPTSVTLTAVRFADAQHVLAVGHGGVVLASADGGESWQRRLDGKVAARLEVATANASNDPAKIKAAERLLAEGPDKPLLDVLTFDAKRALVVGAYGAAFYTADGGASWTSWRDRMPNPKELHLYAVRSLGDRIVVAGEGGLMLQSRDGGASFSRLDVPYQGSFFTVELPDPRSIVVAGLRGNVLMSSDRGGSWRALVSPLPVSITGSAMGAEGDVLLVNQAGMVFSVGHGALRPVNTHPMPPLNGIVSLDNKRALTVSSQGAQRIDLPLAGKASANGLNQ